MEEVVLELGLEGVERFEEGETEGQSIQEQQSVKLQKRMFFWQV